MESPVKAKLLLPSLYVLVVSLSVLVPTVPNVKLNGYVEVSVFLVGEKIVSAVVLIVFLLVVNTG